MWDGFQGMGARTARRLAPDTTHVCTWRSPPRAALWAPDQQRPQAVHGEGLGMAFSQQAHPPAPVSLGVVALRAGPLTGVHRRGMLYTHHP